MKNKKTLEKDNKTPKTPKIYADAPNGYMPDGSKLIDVPELYLTSEDYDRIRKAVVDDVLEAAKQDKKDAFDKALEGSKEYLKEQAFVDNPETHPMVVMAVDVKEPEEIIKTFKEKLNLIGSMTSVYLDEVDGLSLYEAMDDAFALISQLKAENDNYSYNIKKLTADHMKLQAELERLKNSYKQVAWERDVFLEEMEGEN